LELDPWAIQILKNGYRLEFWKMPKLVTSPVVRSGSKNPHKNFILKEQFQTLLDKGAIEEVENPESPGFYSHLFVVPKPSGEWRPIINLSALNKSLVIPRFKMDTTSLIRNSMRLGNWVFKLDLKDAYFQVPIHKNSRKFLRLEFMGKIYQFRALPFGVSTAPWIFTRLVKVVKEYLQKKGMILFQFLDDWLGDAESRVLAVQRAQYLVHLVEHLGFLINYPKSDLVPKQRFEFVGVLFDLTTGTVFPTPKNLVKLSTVVQFFLRVQEATAQQWLTLTGTLGAQEAMISYGRLHLRPLQLFLNSHWKRERSDLTVVIPVPTELRWVLLWWAQEQNLTAGVPMLPISFSTRIFTDASTKGWGAHCNSSLAQGKWSQEETQLHINLLEMRAVKQALLAFRPLQGQGVLIATDNMTVVSYINKQGGTRSHSLWLETWNLFLLVRELNITLRARHIPGRLNVVADSLSREGQILPTEWSLHKDLVQSLFQEMGSPNIDLFATRFNYQCPTYVSPVPDSQAWEVDALSISWEGMNAYAYPPHQIMTQVLNKFLETRICSLLLIAPYWPKQVWFARLLELVSSPPVRLPLWKNLLRQPQSNVFHQNPRVLDLHVWRLLRQH